MAVKIKNLYFSYGNKNILKNINFHVEKGKLIGVLGPNGSGKSTLLKNISGYLKSEEENSIEIFGKKLKSYSNKERAKLLALVPQKSRLESDLTVLEFVSMGRLPYLKNDWTGYKKEDMEIIKKKLKELNLEKFSNRSALSLSGGEFQKILLARALIQNPKILLLDEPTSSLDLNFAMDFMWKIKQNIENKKITGIVVLHDLNLASIFCDKIYFLKEGRIVCKGTPREVLTNKNLKEVYDLDCKIVYEKETPIVIPYIKYKKEKF